MPQITARLSPGIRDRFDDYATKVGLDASELARLLILREIHVGRLSRFAKSHPGRAGTPPKGKKERKLTAHFHQRLRRQVAQFSKRVRAARLSREAAVRILAEQELVEKWLAKALKCARGGLHER